jgi:hypothetical protein
MDITFAKRSNERASIAPMSASVHRRGKHLYLHVRLARTAAQDLAISEGCYAGVGFSSDRRTLALRWGVDSDQGWAFSRRKDGSMSCSVKIDQFENIELTQKFHFAGQYNMIDGNTITLPLSAETRQ